MNSRSKLVPRSTRSYASSSYHYKNGVGIHLLSYGGVAEVQREIIHALPTHAMLPIC
jgi:hypothetical protein